MKNGGRILAWLFLIALSVVIGYMIFELAG